MSLSDINKGLSGTSAVTFNISPATAKASGVTFSAVAGEGVIFGDIVYIKSDGKLWKADANAAGLFPAQFMAIATIATDTTGLFLRDGFATLSSWNWTAGLPLYLSTTAAGMTHTAPAATDDCIQVLGYAMSATTVSFRASTDFLTRA